jgi:hypothetical protein
MVNWSWSAHSRSLFVSGNHLVLHATYDLHAGSCHVVVGQVFGIRVTGAGGAHVGQQDGPLAITVHGDTLTLSGFLLG